MTEPFQILIIEDDELIVKAIKFACENKKLKALFARTGDDALAIIRSQPHISAVWLDHYLPGAYDGIAIVQELKSSPKGKDIPVFVVSNTANDENIARYMELGIVRYFIKVNYSIDEILHEVLTYVNH
jgi:CheY-like chemotaxis protein